MGLEDRDRGHRTGGSWELRMERLGLFLDDHPGAATRPLPQTKDKAKCKKSKNLLV